MPIDAFLHRFDALDPKKSIWRRIQCKRRRIACLWWFMVISHPFNPNSMQFDADQLLFTSIRRLGSKKIHLVSNLTQKASNCVFMVVYGKFTPY